MMNSSKMHFRCDYNTVLRTVSKYFGLNVTVLKGVKRDKRTAIARQVAMYLMRLETDLSSTEIGRILGGRDHTTVLYGCQRIANSLDVDENLRHDLNNIYESLSVVAQQPVHWSLSKESNEQFEFTKATKEFILPDKYVNLG